MTVLVIFGIIRIQTVVHKFPPIKSALQHGKTNSEITIFKFDYFKSYALTTGRRTMNSVSSMAKIHLCKANFWDRLSVKQELGCITGDL